ncbi:MAG: hypothetical protein ACTSQ4_02400 [Candidatus Heimdallarchaeaceae archaeon]
MAGQDPEHQFYEKQQDKQIANDPNALYADNMREEKVNNILQQINPDNLVSDIEHRIRGEKKDIYSDQWVKISESAKPISEDLVSTFMSFLGSVLNQNTSMSNFSREEINNIMVVIIEWIRDDFLVNAKKYDIEGRYQEYDRIAHIICISCFAVFKRALNGQESRNIFRVLKITESSGQGGKKKSFTDNFRFW